MRSLERIVALLPWRSSVCSSACTSGTAAHCDHTVTVSMDIWIVQCSGYPDTTACPPTPSRLFPVPRGSVERGRVRKCKLDVISPERLKIEVKLLLSANRKSYAASISTKTGDLEWPWMYKINVIRIARCLCGSWASCKLVLTCSELCDFRPCWYPSFMASDIQRQANQNYPVVLYYQLISKLSSHTCAHFPCRQVDSQSY